MTLLIIVAAVIAYLVVGGLTARGHAVDSYRRAESRARVEWHTPSYMESAKWLRYRWAMAGWFFAWPFAAVVQLVTMRPLESARDRAAQLRAEADQYDALIASCEDPTDRDLMRKGQSALRERAREVDL